MSAKGPTRPKPSFSIVIPARDEAAVIGRCLRAVTSGLRPNESEIIVVCNGCTDATAEVAREYSPTVRVAEIPRASKTQALNLGDSLATAFPRFYLDADVEVDSGILRAIASTMTEDSSILAAAPRGVVCVQGRPFVVRSFYKVWTALPYFREGPFGAGVYGFSREGRSRFARFPEIISDDGFARLVVAPHERFVPRSGTFRIYPPKTISGLLRINIRARAGLLQLRSLHPELYLRAPSNPARSLLEVLRRPKLWIHSPVYFGLMLIADIAARRKLRKGREHIWERDSTSREPCPNDGDVRTLPSEKF